MTHVFSSTQETEKKNTTLKSRVAQLEASLEEARAEIARLTAASSGGSSVGTDDKSTTVGTLFSLKKELESERLNSANLKRQLEMEQQLGKSVQEKHKSLVDFVARGQTASTSTAAPAAAAAASSYVSSSSAFSNSFGFGTGFTSSTTR